MEAITNGFLLFHKGGIVMYILLLCSLFVVYIGMERAIFILTWTQEPPLPGIFIRI